jgi:hypothetical protein
MLEAWRNELASCHDSIPTQDTYSGLMRVKIE